MSSFLLPCSLSLTIYFLKNYFCWSSLFWAFLDIFFSEFLCSHLSHLQEGGSSGTCTCQARRKKRKSFGRVCVCMCERVWVCKRTCDKHEREEEETEREKDKGEIRLFLYPCAHMCDGVREGEEEEKEKRKRYIFYFALPFVQVSLYFKMCRTENKDSSARKWNLVYIEKVNNKNSFLKNKNHEKKFSRKGLLHFLVDWVTRPDIHT